MIENQHFPKMEAFVKQAEELVKSDPDAEQAVVMWTERGNRFHFHQTPTTGSRQQPR